MPATLSREVVHRLISHAILSIRRMGDNTDNLRRLTQRRERFDADGVIAEEQHFHDVASTLCSTMRRHSAGTRYAGSSIFIIPKC